MVHSVWNSHVRHEGLLLGLEVRNDRDVLGPEVLRQLPSALFALNTSWFLFAALTPWHQPRRQSCLSPLASTRVCASWQTQLNQLNRNMKSSPRVGEVPCETKAYAPTTQEPGSQMKRPQQLPDST